MTRTVERDLPDDDARDLLRLVRQVVDKELTPAAAEHESSRTFPRDELRRLGELGLLGLPYSTEYGGGGQPYGVYLQVVEELARGWLTIAESVAVHTLSCVPTALFGTADQKAEWLPDMLGGSKLGAYCLSEPGAGSDAASLTTRARPQVDADGTAAYVVDGTKAWITHSGVADFYNLMVRTGEDGPRGITCLLAPADTPGLGFGARERTMGLRGSPVAQVHLDRAVVPARQRIGEEGQGFTIAMAALDGGRLGIAACAVGLAQAAFELALDYANTRRQFGRSILDFQGVSFMLADMATGITAGRALYLEAARRRDSGRPHSREASMAKLFCSDMAMSVTTNAVQILGGAGYTEDFPAERYMREAKVLQIFEGTNQVQRLVISRQLAREAG